MNQSCEKEFTMSSTTKPEKKGGMKKSVVDHSYNDYSQVDIKELVPTFKGVKKGQFPAKLHRVSSLYHVLFLR